MLQYNVKFIKFAIDGKDVFYDIQINDLISLNSNLVCIKYTTLYKLHKKLKEENPYSEVNIEYFFNYIFMISFHNSQSKTKLKKY